MESLIVVFRALSSMIHVLCLLFFLFWKQIIIPVIYIFPSPYLKVPYNISKRHKYYCLCFIYSPAHQGKQESSYLPFCLLRCLVDRGGHRAIQILTGCKKH